MSDQQTMDDNEQSAQSADGTAPDTSTLQAELEVLRAENRRLREEYSRARRSEYRRTALVLLGAGLLAVLGGVLVTSAQTVLFALGGTGIFIGVLTYYLTPERMLPASVGQAVYTASARTFGDVVGELGLQDKHVYVPTSRAGESAVRLFVPQHSEYSVPDDDALGESFVVGTHEDERGFSVHPTGDQLFEQFEETLSGAFGPEPAQMADQLSDALVEQFELLDSATVEASDGQVTVAVTESAYGSLEQFDHPVVSLLAGGLARGLETPVSASVARADGQQQADVLVTCRWEQPEADEAT